MIAAVGTRLNIWWTILRVSVEERMVYRGDFAMGTIMRFLPIITQIFLWWSIFEARFASQGGIAGLAASVWRRFADPESNFDDDIAGYAFGDMVAYYLLTMLSRAASSMPGLASGIAQQIRDGEIKKYLIQPIDLLNFLLIGRIAHKAAYYTVATIPFAAVFYLCGWAFEQGWPDPIILAAFIAALFMGFMMGFFLESCIGLIGFWFLEVTSLLFIYMLMSFFLSGHMFPLDMLNAWPWAAFIVDVMPLKYLAYYPAAIFLGKIPPDQLGAGLLAEFAWLVFFIVLARVMLYFGIKRYSGFGG